MQLWFSGQQSSWLGPTELWESAFPVQEEAAWRVLRKPFVGSVTLAALLCEAVQGTPALGEVPCAAGHRALQLLGAMETMC